MMVVSKKLMGSCVFLVLLMTVLSYEDMNKDPNFNLLFTSDRTEMNEVDVKVEMVGTNTISLPSYLAQSQYMHNGCGMWEVSDDRELTNVFDCFGKLHSWYFHDDLSVKFSSSLLKSSFLNTSLEEGTIHPVILMGLEEPRWGMKDRATAVASNAQMDNLNVNIWDYGLKNEQTGEPLLMATSDFIRYLTVGKDSFQTAPFTFGNLEDTLTNGTSSSAHSKYIPGTRTSINYALTTPLTSKGHAMLTVFTQEYGSSSVDRLFQMEVGGTPYMHSFSVSEHYVVFFLGPCNLHASCMFSEMRNSWKGMSECFIWDEEATTAPIIVIQHSGEGAGRLVAVAQAPPLFSFHHVNAFETKSSASNEILLTMEMASFPDNSPMQAFYFDRTVTMNQTARDAAQSSFIPQRYTRFEISLGKASVDPTADPNLDAKVETSYLKTDDAEGRPYPFDFPLINPKFAGQKQCWAYGLATPFAGGSGSFSACALVKKNTCDESLPVQVLDLSKEKQWISGDASFVPNPAENAEEDDGVLLQVYVDGSAPEGEGKSYLRIIDAKNMETIALLYPSTDMNWHMPYGFHGNWFKW